MTSLKTLRLISFYREIFFIVMSQLSLGDAVKLVLGYCLVKLGKLKYDRFTEQELNELIAPHFPQSFDISVPIGNGTLRLIEGQLAMPIDSQRLHLQCLAGLEIKAMGNPIYRAHAIVQLSACPRYIINESTLTLVDMKVDDIHLVNDEYALIKDTQFLIDKLLPVSGILGSPLKQAINLLTAGTSDQALNYLNMYLGGSKQRILDFHRPQIEKQLLTEVANFDLDYEMQAHEWREMLFAKLGKTVTVESQELRFNF